MIKKMIPIMDSFTVRQRTQFKIVCTSVASVWCTVLEADIEITTVWKFVVKIISFVTYYALVGSKCKLLDADFP